eukprot:s1954_g7.t1
MICLSSGEAEFNGGVSACSEGLFYHQLLGFLGLTTKMRVHLDSSAARGVFQRQGAGRIRHLEVKSLCVQQALKQKKFSLHAVGTNDNVADVGTKALPVAKLEKFRSEMNVISEVEFRATEQEKIHTASSVVGAVNKLQSVIQVMTALGMVQPVKAEKKGNEDTGSWLFYGLMFCVLWTMMTMAWTVISAVRGWMKSPKKGSETVEDRSQCVRGGVQEENQNLRQRGVKEKAKAKAKSSAASSSSSEMVRPPGGEPNETRSQKSVRPSEGDQTPRSVKSQYAYEKREGINIIYDRCYPFDGEKPLQFYKSSAGECVHMSPQCRGLRNRKTPVQMLKVCAYCHDAHMHRAMRLVPCSAMMREGHEGELRAGATRGTKLSFRVAADRVERPPEGGTGAIFWDDVFPEVVYLEDDEAQDNVLAEEHEASPDFKEEHEDRWLHLGPNDKICLPVHFRLLHEHVQRRMCRANTGFLQQRGEIPKGADKAQSPPSCIGTSFEAAREIFKMANHFFVMALEYFLLDGWVTEHVRILQELSQMYRTLHFWEKDPKRSAAMLKRRSWAENMQKDVVSLWPERIGM